MALKQITTFVAVLALGMITTMSAQAKTTWNLPLAWPASNYIVKNVAHFADEVAEATDEEVQITLHPGGSLGFKGPEMLSAVRSGLVPIGDMLLNQQVGFNPLLGLESLPFLINDFHGLKEFGKFYMPLLNSIYAKNNQKILFRVPWPQQMIFTKAKITSIEDLQDIKIRTYNRSSTAIFESIGMNPVQLPWGQVVPALAAGTIDAVATSSPSAVDGSFWELLNYAYPTRQTWNTDVISVNLDAWSALSEAQQEAIVAVAERLEPKFWASTETVDADSLTRLKEKGMTIGTLSDEFRDQLSVKAAGIRQTRLKSLGEKAQTVVDAFNAR